MTIENEELLISRPPQSPTRLPQPKAIRIECQAEERHFMNSSPIKINGCSKPVRFTMDNQIRPGQYRSEIVIQNNPDMDLYIKRLRVAFQAHDDLSINTNFSRSPRCHSVHGPSKQKHGKYRSVSLPRSNSQALLHQWIDDICSNEKLMADDDICFFIKNGEFLARI